MYSSSAIHEPVLRRDARCLSAVFDAELAIDVGEVELHGLRRDPELLCDLVVREAASERAEDRELALREPERLGAGALGFLAADRGVDVPLERLA